MTYGPREYLHFALMESRQRSRERRWEHAFQLALKSDSLKVPHPVVLQIIPTEVCNLRCPMCNQWGLHGAHRTDGSMVSHMPFDHLDRLLESVDPASVYLSVHGGEPFAYQHIGELLESLTHRPFDVMFSTNGTLMERHIEPLSRIRNLAILLSIDGDEATHDEIRGKGMYRRSRDAVWELFVERRRRDLPMPMLMISMVICEWTGSAAEEGLRIAKEFNAFALNYNMRWFLPHEAGEAYDTLLRDHFGIKPTQAWKGWLSDAEPDKTNVAERFLREHIATLRRRILPPYVITTPKQLAGEDFSTYFKSYETVFGNETCFMPFYWARIHSNGNLIFCPGHPDVVGGNVFETGLEQAFNSPRSVEFRRFMLTNRLPVCNRCCGLYMIDRARTREQRVRRSIGLSPAVDVHYPL